MITPSEEHVIEAEEIENISEAPLHQGGARGGQGGCSPSSGKNFVSVGEFSTKNCVQLHRKILLILIFSPPIGEPSPPVGQILAPPLLCTLFKHYWFYLRLQREVLSAPYQVLAKQHFTDWSHLLFYCNNIGPDLALNVNYFCFNSPKPSGIY